ncbi:MAG: hypothetical protein HDS68_03960 [Bacteroidales bacterium]|nr:hypothetical protein [Bacteroidales bacterium]
MNLRSESFRMAAASVVAVLSLLPAMAARHEPYDRSRIYWDMSTRVDAMSWGGNYGRMVQLLDGRLMVVGAYGDGLAYTLSSDYGASWSTPEMIVRHPSGYVYGSPDFTQLADGTILVGLNPRPNEPYSEDRKFGIRVMRSSDCGKTWSGPIFVFDAEYYGEDGCWEPSFLQLPSGEVQCFFSVELKGCGDQEIMISRSYDNGLTWGPAERVCYRAGYRDGMATAIITDAGEIVGIIEDFGHNNYQWVPRATTFRCSLEDNWSQWVDAGSRNRDMIFEREEDMQYNSGAPYIRKLPGGETVASWMGNHDGRATEEISKYPLFVAVGDADARNFKAVSMPFYRGECEFANWGSLGVADDGYLYALANVGYSGGNCVLGLIKGMPRKGFEAPFGTPVLDANPLKDAWTYPLGKQLTMGTHIGNRMEMDFLYDNENLYFYAYVVDRDIVNDAVDKDGLFLYLDVAGCCDTYPQEGMFRFFFSPDGSTTLRCGSGGKWQPEIPADGITYVLDAHKTFYRMEVAIPWTLLGEDKAPGCGREMRVNVQVRDRRQNALKIESIPETTDKASWTWPELTLGENSSVGSVGADRKVSITANGLCVTVEGDDTVDGIEAYTPSGVRATAAGGGVLTLPAHGIYLIKVRFADGSELFRKVAL